MSDKKGKTLNEGLKAGIAGGLERKTGKSPVSPRFTELIGKALIDQDFRKRLFVDQEQTIREFELTDDDLTVLNEITEETLARHMEDIGGAAAWKIYVEISKSF
jgi:hypothetical protein